MSWQQFDTVKYIYTGLRYHLQPCACTLYSTYCSAVSVRMHTAQLLHKTGFLACFILHCFICCPSDSTVSDAGMLGLKILWHWQSDALTTRLDLFHIKGRTVRRGDKNWTPPSPHTPRLMRVNPACVWRRAAPWSLICVSVADKDGKWQLPSPPVRHHTCSPLSGHSGSTKVPHTNGISVSLWKSHAARQMWHGPAI
jgi:hypothetical protein